MTQRGTRSQTQTKIESEQLVDKMIDWAGWSRAVHTSSLAFIMKLKLAT
jgi:hypothetical protein